ncbi:uncharacterized protein LOC119068329 [Bradysia coprophila]|uniref:uncharacterized protein LOC119068329 n=1 Tax=Bradysia coprophila TaxID=38358 RepID=UPI00187DC21A|nr:uncharacterized protein LOC119068329 [Bradysia coprophila]
MLSKIRTPLRDITIEAFGRGVNCNPNEVGQDKRHVPHHVAQVKNDSIDGEQHHATPEVAGSMLDLVLDINRQLNETSNANAIEVEQDQSYCIPDPVEDHSVDGEQSHITTDVSGTGLKLGMKRKLLEPTSSTNLEEKRIKVLQHPDWATNSLGFDVANNVSPNQAERETNESRFTCERCNKSLASRYKKQHKQSCSLKYYQCPWCNFQPKSGRPSFVKRHMVACKAKVTNEAKEDSSVLGDVPAIPNVAPRAADPSESNMNKVYSVERLSGMDEDATVPDDVLVVSNVAPTTDGAAAPSDPNKSQVVVAAPNIFPLKCDQCNTSLMLHIQLV